MIKVFSVIYMEELKRVGHQNWLEVRPLSDQPLQLKPIEERYPEEAKEANGMWLENLALAHALNSLVEMGNSILSVTRCSLANGAAWQVVTSD